MNEKYHNTKLEELISDPYFQEWVLQPTAEHEKYWNAFQDENPESKVLISEAKILVQSIHQYFKQDRLDQEKLNEQFIELEENSKLFPLSKNTPFHSPKRPLLLRIMVAASILIILGVTVWIWSDQNALRTFSTDYSEWKTIELPDGSLVELNANSEISFAKNWKETAIRKVWLSGEAFFQVKKNHRTGVKFQVITNDLTVEVLGTSFNVRSRAGATEVFLEEGNVNLDLEKENINMVPGDHITYSSIQKKIIRNHLAKSASEISWKDGILILQDKSNAFIFEKIEEIFGVEIQVINQELLDKMNTIRIPMDKLDFSIPIMERVIGVSIDHQDNFLIIK